jgi:dihydroceramidase
MVSFWGEPDAGVQFCEPKFTHSENVYEFGNTWSNIAYVLVGCAGLLDPRRRRSRSFFTPDVCLILVGLTSALFHMTGRYWAQILDELSMLMWTSSVLVVLSSFLDHVLCFDRFSLFFTSIAFMLYAVLGDFRVFLAIFVAHVLLVFKGLRNLSGLHPRTIPLVLSLLFLATVCWLADQACFLQTNFHVLWHLLSALSCAVVHGALANLAPIHVASQIKTK